MSIEAMVWAWSLPVEVLENPNDRWILVAHANSANHDGRKCFPSTARICSMTGLGERTVRYSRKRLVEQGIMVDLGVRDGDGLREFDLPGVRGEGVRCPPASDAPRHLATENVSSDAPYSQQNPPQEEVSNETQKKPDPIRETWELWQSLWTGVKGINPGARKLEAKTRRVIDNALKLSGEAKVRAAVAGHRNSPHHIGDNDRKTVYGDIRYALKGIGNETDQERIEKMARLAPVNGIVAGETGGLSEARIRTLVDEVEQALELPGNAAIRRRGAEAKTRLESAGFQVTRNGTKVRLAR